MLALQIYSREFDVVFLGLPADTQARIQSAIDRLGSKLSDFQHHKLTGMNCYRLRVGITESFMISASQEVICSC